MSNLMCSSCGHENRSKIKFCTQCGQNLIENVPVGPRLLILLGGQNSIVFQLEKGKSTIGRDLGNKIVINDDQISNSHATVFYENEDIWIEDMESSNGVMVSGKRISERTLLYSGCLIKLGSTILKFESN